MAKANIHTASRDELVEAGVRAELADEILKLRRKGEIEGAEALEELPGVGPATVHQLRKALDFSARARSGSGDNGKARERAENGEHREAERRPALERAADSARAAANVGTTAA